MILIQLPRNPAVIYSRVLFLVLAISYLQCQRPIDHYSDPNWSEYQGDPGRNQYRTHDEINIDNVRQLQLRWSYQSGDLDPGNSTQIQCNPLILNGVLYGTSPKLTLFAIDAADGSEYWRFNPKDFVDKKFGTGVNRGLAYWQRGDDCRILYTVGPNLFAIDCQEGKPIPTFGNHGVVDLKQGLGRNLDETYFGNNTPGAIFKDLIIIGGRTSEGADHAPGHIRAYSVVTGEMHWIFHTIPLPGEFGYDSWPDSAFLKSGGANAWSGFSVDHQAELIYAPTGSASFDFYGGDRAGSNLFANSIIALDANTGERVWHFQARHHDLWDRDFPAPPNLISVFKDGATIEALAQISKSGDLFVFDRISGKPLYPIQEVEVPASKLKGEQAWPTQPVPSGYPKFTRDYLTEGDLAIRSEAAQTFAKTAWKAAAYGEFVPPSLDRQILFPGMDGGGEWGGAAWDPELGVMYVNSNEMTWQIKMEHYAPMSLGQSIYQTHCQSCHAENFTGNAAFGNVPTLVGVQQRKSPAELKSTIETGKGIMPGFNQFNEREVEAVVRYISNEIDTAKNMIARERHWPYPYVFAGYAKFLAPDKLPIIRPPWGQLTAIDMNSQSIIWQVPLGDIDSLQIEGHPVTGTENYGGPLVTGGGLVFIAATADNKFRAFDKHTGDLLWQVDLPTGGYATPATYLVDGKQYIVIACGGGKLGSESGDSYLAFSL